MTRKEKWGISFFVIYMLAVIFVSIFYPLWGNLMWLLVLIAMLFATWKMRGRIESQSYIIRSQERDIDFLMSLDPFKYAKKSRTEERIASANCHHYLQRIGELKAENEQLKILNKNLIENKFNGKANGKRKS